MYFDDWFLINQIKKFLMADKEKSLSLVKLGFLVNLEKLTLCPSQTITYIWAVFLLNKGMVSPTLERILKIEQAIVLIKREPTAQNFLHLLGLMASCIELVPHVRLFMRPVQLHLLHYSRPVTRDLQATIPLSKHLESHLNWWQSRDNLLLGKPFRQQPNTNVLTTDASKRGYGGHLENLICQGTWSVQQKTLHINCLELEAVYLSVQHFLPQLRGQNVLIRSDNTTVVQYINKQGGTRSPRLCYQAWDLWKMAIGIV